MKKTLALAMFILLFSVTGCDPRPVAEAPTPIRTLYPATLPAVVTQPPSGTEVAGGDQTPEPGQTGTAGGGAVEAGQEVFETNCAVCHNLTAEAKVGPGLAGLFERDQLPNGDPVTDENLRVWITNGGGAMPPVPLPEDELTAVIAFLHEATQ